MQSSKSGLIKVQPDSLGKGFRERCLRCVLVCGRDRSGKCTAARVPFGFAPHSPPVAEDRSFSGQLREKQLNEEMEQHCTDGSGRAPVQS